ncbi:Uncharacterised protein [Enterobacter cloacae]|nr:Uncharacterised protein [Enterobacter cloacae]
MLRTRRVLLPQGATMVLPCIGSLSQITGCPAARTASTSGGRRSPTFCAPIRAISVRRPGSRRGSRRSQSASNWSRPISGPTLQATGLSTSASSATWAPSTWRVRSPIHGQWVEPR